MKSRLLLCLIWITELLCMICRGIGPHHMVSGNSHCFSLVVAGTWGIFSSYNGDGPSKLVFVLLRQDSCLDATDISEFSTRLGRELGTPL